MSGLIGYHNVGLLVHGPGGSVENASKFWSGGDGKAEHKSYDGKMIYSGYGDWTKLRVYVKFTSKIQDLIYSRSLVKPPTTTMPWQGNYYKTATRYYKGWCLDEVFDYRRQDQAKDTEITNNNTTSIVYAREHTNDSWYGYKQRVNVQKNNRRSWYFGDGEGEVTQHNNQPVSYTHLTLPTKRIV